MQPRSAAGRIGRKLIRINVFRLIASMSFLMPPSINSSLSVVAQAAQIAQRLQAYALLCQQVAGASSDQETVEQLRLLADACTSVAADAEAVYRPVGPIH